MTERQTRAVYHLTLNDLITGLEEANPDAKVSFKGGAPNLPHSYFGQSDDLAFTPDGKDVTVSGFLAIVQSALNSVYEGRQGVCRMDGHTPLWISEEEKASGLAITGFSASDTAFKLVTMQV